MGTEVELPTFLRNLIRPDLTFFPLIIPIFAHVTPKAAIKLNSGSDPQSTK